MADTAQLDDRKAAILRTVVEEYVATAQPVGSSRVAEKAAVNVSSATVRNELGHLESEGYLHQPHTSAGRIPTDKGYRFFVDHLAGPPTLGRSQNLEVKEFFDHTSNELEHMLSDTTRLLTRLTNYAAVITGPGTDVATVRSVQLVDLSEQMVLAVVVMSNGSIEKRAIDIDVDSNVEIESATLGTASAALDEAFRGFTLGALPGCEPVGIASVDTLIALTSKAIAEEEPTNPVYVGGRAVVAESFEAVDTVREVLTMLERQFIIVSLIRDVLGRGMSVAIGNETGVQTLAECSLVVAPYEVEGETVGTIGLLGPTRMNYSRALAAVAVVGTSLSDRLSSG